MIQLLCIIVGIVFWTFIEYATHRWILHGPLKAYHQLHHLNPRARSRVPWWLAIPILFIVSLASVWIALGILVTWIFSSFLHTIFHHKRLKNKYFKELQKAHITHHRFNYYNYGVMVTFWDRLFHTRYNKRYHNVPD
jgi:4-hydroxysphinganine ceramide fatty acyl 2-hydroxylase